MDTLKATPDTLAGLLHGLDQAAAARARGGDEGWSVVEVVCHLRDAEERGIERMRLMRDTDDPKLAGYDQEQWARERNYAATPIRDALQSFVDLRAVRLAEMAALPAEAWDRTGQHEELGTITILSQTLHTASHDAVHLAQIARQIMGIGA